MKLLFISKRHPQQRDLLTRPYGRFFHLPIALAALGHEVNVILLDFRGQATQRAYHNGVNWLTIDIRTPGPWHFFQSIKAEARNIDPDWMIGLSDTWTGIIAHRISKRLGCRLALDAYDNYEAYMPWNKPLHWLWHRALADADLVTAAGPQLAKLLGRHAQAIAGPKIIPMSADPAFVPMDKISARRRLDLPLATPLIGYYGSWAKQRGTDNILDILKLVKVQIPNVKLVLSGRPPAFALQHPGVIALGYIDDAVLPNLVNAIDVACILTRNTAFGKYSYPAKLCEAMACGTPVVATDTAPVRWMLRDDESSLVTIDHADAFARRVIERLSNKSVVYGAVGNWSDSAIQLQTLLEQRSTKLCI
jgi:glycosyltransferase involved in cell wall biosynthesis